LFEDYLSELIPKAVFCKTVYTYIDGQEKSFLFFDYVKDYYEYLMLLFYNRKEAVCECELCSRYFIPKTKKKTLYCDRGFKDGKTCKQIGPLIKHKSLRKMIWFCRPLIRKRTKCISEWNEHIHLVKHRNQYHLMNIHLGLTEQSMQKICISTMSYPKLRLWR
jgi:hypothetical protein